MQFYCKLNEGDEMCGNMLCRLLLLMSEKSVL